MRLDLPGRVALGILNDPLLKVLDHRRRRHYRATEARRAARDTGIAEGSVHAQLEPAHARFLVIHPVPRFHHDSEVRRAATVDQVCHAIGHTGMLAGGNVHRHAAIGQADQQVANQRYFGLDQCSGHLGEGRDHAFGIGSAKAENPVIDLLRRWLHVRFVGGTGKDLLGFVQLQVGIDR
ncbi:hypothetical protein D3C73_1140580 [compost metagenome]